MELPRQCRTNHLMRSLDPAHGHAEMFAFGHDCNVIRTEDNFDMVGNVGDELFLQGELVRMLVSNPREF